VIYDRDGRFRTREPFLWMIDATGKVTEIKAVPEATQIKKEIEKAISEKLDKKSPEERKAEEEREQLQKMLKRETEGLQERYKAFDQKVKKIKVINVLKLLEKAGIQGKTPFEQNSIEYQLRTKGKYITEDGKVITIPGFEGYENIAKRLLIDYLRNSPYAPMLKNAQKKQVESLKKLKYLLTESAKALPQSKDQEALVQLAEQIGEQLELLSAKQNDVEEDEPVDAEKQKKQQEAENLLLDEILLEQMPKTLNQIVEAAYKIPSSDQRWKVLSYVKGTDTALSLEELSKLLNEEIQKIKNIETRTKVMAEIYGKLDGKFRPATEEAVKKLKASGLIKEADPENLTFEQAYWLMSWRLKEVQRLEPILKHQGDIYIAGFYGTKKDRAFRIGIGMSLLSPGIPGFVIQFGWIKDVMVEAPSKGARKNQADHLPLLGRLQKDVTTKNLVFYLRRLEVQMFQAQKLKTQSESLHQEVHRRNRWGYRHFFLSFFFHVFHGFP